MPSGADTSWNVECVLVDTQRKLRLQQLDRIVKRVAIDDAAYDACSVTLVGSTPPDHSRFDQDVWVLRVIGRASECGHAHARAAPGAYPTLENWSYGPPH